MPFAENLGTGGGSLDAQYGSSPTANTNAPLLLDPRTSGNFVYTPGTAGNYVAVPHSPSLNILGTEGTPFLSLPGFAISSQYASSPDTGALDITGDIDLRCRAQLTPVVPLSGSANLITKGGLGGNYAFFYGVDTLGRLFFEWSNNGVTTTYKTSTVAATVPAGVPYWYRATMDADNGAGGNDIAFYVSPDGITWTQVGTTVTTAGVAVINNSASALQLGGYGGSNFTDGRIYRAQVLNGINGTVVFDADFTQQALGSRGFIESTGKLVSLVGNAAQIVDGTTYGTMPSTSVAGGWTVPDSAALDVSDLEITARLSLNDWTAGVNKTVVAKYDNGSGSGSYIFYISTNAQPFAQYKVGGVVQPLVAGTNYPFVNGGTYWVRCRRIAATGVWRFDWAADSETEPTVWTNVGGDRPGTAGALDNSTALTTIGAFNNAVNAYISQGRFYRAIIRNANTGGTKVLDADFTRQLQFASTFTEGSSQLATVTTVGAARIERDRDLDLRVKVALDDWTPADVQALIDRWEDSPFQTFYWIIDTLGRMVLAWSPVAGASALAATSNALGLADGSTKWLRVTLDVNNGSNGHTVTFYTSDDGIAWTLLQAPITTTGATSITRADMPTYIGVMRGITGPFWNTAGKFFNAEIRNGINGPAVLDIDFTDAITTGAETYLPDTVTEVIPEALQYLPNLGWGGAALNARFGSAVTADTNDPLLLTHTGTNYLYLPGVTNSYASSPNSAALNITGDIDIRAFIACDDWTSSSQNVVVGKFVAPSLSFLLLIDVVGRMELRWSTNGTTLTNFAVSTTSIPVADGSDLWVRVTLDVDNGAAGNTTTFFISQDGVTWAQLGTPITAAGVTSIFAGTEPLAIGQLGPGSGGIFAGKYYRLQIRNGIAGTVVFDANFTTGITSGAQTTFTESSSNAATVTINRSTSGRKSVAVVQDVLLFGTDDYLEVPDNDLLDFGANSSFTAMSAYRQWGGMTGTLIAKTDSLGATLVGWDQYSSTGTARAQIGDGTRIDAGGPTAASGAIAVVTSIRNTTTDDLTVYLGTTPGTPLADTTTGTLANSQVLRVGRLSGAGTTYADMEWRGSAVWRRALTPAEVALVNTHYTTGPTAASTILMQQAAFWIDAGTRSVAQINRALIGSRAVACARCVWAFGTDDFFEVPASDLFNFDQGEDFTLLVVNRAWPNQQGTDRALMATQSSATASAPGWALSTTAALSTEQPNFANHGKAGDGSNGVTAIAPAKFIGQLSATWLVRNTLTDTFTAYQGSAAGTPVTDVTTGTIGNTNVMRIGRLSSTGTNYLNGEIVAAVVWRRALTTAERNAVLAYYGV